MEMNKKSYEELKAEKEFVDNIIVNLKGEVDFIERMFGLNQHGHGLKFLIHTIKHLKYLIIDEKSIHRALQYLHYINWSEVIKQ